MLLKKGNFIKYTLIMTKYQTRKITKHLLHSSYSELANQTWGKFLYLDDQHFYF